MFTSRASIFSGCLVVVVVSFKVDAAQHQLQASGWNRLSFCCVADSTSLQKSGSCSVVCQNLSIIYEENPENEPQSGDTRVWHSGCLPPVMVPFPHLPNLPPPAGCQTAEHYNVSNRTQRKEDFVFFPGFTNCSSPSVVPNALSAINH